MLLSAERPVAGALAIPKPGATLRYRNGLVSAVLPASTEHVQTDNGGSPGTWEILSTPPRHPGRELPGHQLQASTAHSSAGERRERVDAEVPPNEGNEVRRDGRQEVIAP